MAIFHGYYYRKDLKDLYESISNLNNYPVQTDGDPENPSDNSVNTQEISVFFRNQKQALLNQIEKYPVIVGCVAWLTDFDIIDRMSECKAVSLIVQKEDFLRPDIDSTTNWKLLLRQSYEKLQNPYSRYNFNKISYLSVGNSHEIEPVRCMGNHNRNKKPAFPRMHNKFIVFCEIEETSTHDGYPLINIFPKSVWTGSFNFTFNASSSLENSLLISTDEIVNAYYNEWAQIFSLSEPLDWETDWCAPEFRIGT